MIDTVLGAGEHISGKRKDKNPWLHGIYILEILTYGNTFRVIHIPFPTKYSVHLNVYVFCHVFQCICLFMTN